MLYLDNVEVLGLNYVPKYFGDGNIARYAIDKQVTVRGKVLDLRNSDGITGTWSGMQAIARNQNFDALILNSINFGSGVISNVTFEEGTDVRYKNYTASLSILETGNLYNLVDNNGGNYDAITIQYPQMLENIEESINYQKGADGQTVYNHEISLTYRDMSGINDPKNLARLTATNLFAANNLNGLLGTYDENYNTTYTESYNEIDKSCSFSRAYNFFTVSGTNYSIDYNHTLNLDTDGILTITEEGKIKRIEGTAAIIDLYTYLNTELLNSYTRCNALKTTYYSALDALVQMPIEKGTTVDTFTQLAEYNILYTNDTKMNQGYSWEYKTEINREQDGITRLVENGTIIGVGVLNERAVGVAPLQNSKYYNANEAFRTRVFNKVASRLQAFYNKVVPNFISIKRTKKTKSINRYEGIIEYSEEYSDDLTLLGTAGGLITKIERNAEMTYPVNLKNNFNILGFKEIVQSTENATIGVLTNTITVLGSRNQPIDSFLSQAKGAVSGPFYTRGQGDTLLIDAEYSFDPTLGQFTLTTSQHYYGEKPAKETVPDVGRYF